VKQLTVTIQLTGKLKYKYTDILIIRIAKIIDIRTNPTMTKINWRPHFLAKRLLISEQKSLCQGEQHHLWFLVMHLHLQKLYNN